MNREKLRPIIEKIKNSRGELFWVLLGQGLAFLGGFGGIKLLTNTISIESYGELSLGISIAGILNLFLYGPLANSMMRFFSVYRERNQSQLYFLTIKSIHRTYLKLVLFLGLVAFAGVSFYRDFSWGLWIAASILFGVTSGINGSLFAFFGAARRRKIAALHQAFDTCARPVFAIIVVKFLFDKGSIALLGYFIASAMILTSQMFYFKKQEMEAVVSDALTPGEIEQKESVKEFWRYSNAFIYIGIFGTLTSYADRWMLQYFMGQKYVGIYAVISQISIAPITVIGGMISQFVVPIIFERAGTMTTELQVTNSQSLLRKTGFFYSFVVGLIIVATYLFGHQIITFISNHEVAEYYSALWILGLSQFELGLAELLAVTGFNKNKPHIYIVPKILQAVSFMIAGFILIKGFGIIGAASANAIANFIYLLYVIYINKKH